MHRMGLILLLTTLAISNLTAQDYLRPEEKERTPQEKIDSMRIKYIDSTWTVILEHFWRQAKRP